MEPHSYHAASSATILLVDDEASFCALLAQVLTEAGYCALTAPDGVQALRIVRSTPLALIVLDRFMPQMDGIQTARHLRCNPYTTEIPLLFMSTAIPEDRSLFCATLPKPFTTATFREFVARYARVPPVTNTHVIVPPPPRRE